jgi:hypothetical protein
MTLTDIPLNDNPLNGVHTIIPINSSLNSNINPITDSLNDIIVNNTDDYPHLYIPEEEYTIYNETLLIQWLKIARIRSTQHNVMGKKFKIYHEIFGLPAIILPIAYSPLSALLSFNSNIVYANVSILILTGVLSGIHGFFDFTRKSEKYFQYEAYYADLSTTIMVELSKRRDNRIRADRFVEMVQSKIDCYKSNEPLL